MARALRPNIAGGVYHAMARGNERKDIYLDDEDRRRFLALLEKTARRCRWQCLAYCLMGNHYHLVVSTPLPTLSRGMRLLNGGFAAGFNARHQRVGHLFQGRYRSVLIRSSEHLVIVLKYVIRNPVTAERCRRPEDWPWSSHQATVGNHRTGLVAADATLAWFGDDKHARRRFARFMSSEDIESIERVPTRSVEFPGEPSSPDEPRPPIEALLAAHPGPAGIALAYHEHGYSLRQIAVVLGISRSVVGRRLVAHESTQMLESAT